MDSIGSSQAAVAWALSAARERWPVISLNQADLLVHVERAAVRPDDIALHGAELGLACACAHGDKGAIRVLETEYVAGIEAGLRRLGDGDFVDEVRQTLRQRMLVRPELRIATYAATGPLMGWLKIAALRVGLNMRRAVIRRAETLLVEEIVKELPTEIADLPRYVDVYSAALRRAFVDLGTRDRHLLRLHHVDGLTLDSLGSLFRVHRATVARWLAQARSRIFEEVEAEVKRTLKLSASEFRSILGLVRSYLDPSLSGLPGDPHESS